MALTINTNSASLNAQRNLNINLNGLSKTFQRLSSGLRINQASDDAAGLAISTGLTSQIRGLNQAVRNAGDGLSLLGTAESAIGEQTNLLQRVRELAVQAASDTNSTANRSSLNDEVSSLVTELGRIAETVQFNGLNLLDGTFTSKELQVGAYSGANQRISIDLEGTTAESLGQAFTLGTGATAVGTTAAASGDITITSGGVTTLVGASTADGVSTAGDDSSALSFANAINAVTGKTGVTAEAINNYTNAAQTAGTIASNDLVINGVNIGAVTLAGASDTSLLDAINAVSDSTGVTATLGANNKLTLNAEDGRNIVVLTANSGDTFSGLADGTHRGGVALTGGEGFTVADASNRINVSGAATEGTDNVSTIDITTKTGANTAIEIVDRALAQINSRRSGIGAQVSRLNSVMSNLSAVSENLSASNSRIMDADFASETASLTRTQILQQASISILAQANQAPQLALSLLQ